MKAELIFLLEKFPEFKEQTQLLFDCDEEFQSLSLDYFLCNRSLDQVKLSIEKHLQRLEEYVQLKRVLENAMLRYMKPDNQFEADLFDYEAHKLSRDNQK